MPSAGKSPASILASRAAEGERQGSTLGRRKNGQAKSALSGLGRPKSVELAMADDKRQRGSHSTLSQLVAAHQACLSSHESADQTLALLKLGKMIEERKMRSKIISYPPQDQAEAIAKVAYLFAFILTSRKFLDEEELETVTNTICSFSKGC
jgi:hypothetical protein